MKSPLLVGDIVGTHARFALYEGGVDGNGELHLHRPLSAGAHPTFDQAFRTYLDSVVIDAASLIGGASRSQCRSMVALFASRTRLGLSWGPSCSPR